MECFPIWINKLKRSLAFLTADLDQQFDCAYGHIDQRPAKLKEEVAEFLEEGSEDHDIKLKQD